MTFEFYEPQRFMNHTLLEELDLLLVNIADIIIASEDLKIRSDFNKCTLRQIKIDF